MSLTMVIVSDDTPSRMAHAAVLRKAGHTVIEREDACGLLALLEAERPAMVVLDFVIAGEDGLSLCERIRASPACAHARVVMLAAAEEHAAALRAKQHGAYCMLTRPVSESSLLACARGAAPSRQSLVLRMLRSLGS